MNLDDIAMVVLNAFLFDFSSKMMCVWKGGIIIVEAYLESLEESEKKSIFNGMSRIVKSTSKTHLKPQFVFYVKFHSRSRWDKYWNESTHQTALNKNIYTADNSSLEGNRGTGKVDSFIARNMKNGEMRQVADSEICQIHRS